VSLLASAVSQGRGKGEGNAILRVMTSTLHHDTLLHCLVHCDGSSRSSTIPCACRSSISIVYFDFIIRFGLRAVMEDQCVGRRIHVHRFSPLERVDNLIDMVLSLHLGCCLVWLLVTSGALYLFVIRGLIDCLSGYHWRFAKTPSMSFSITIRFGSCRDEVMSQRQGRNARAAQASGTLSGACSGP
jgi:hypothetical protein